MVKLLFMKHQNMGGNAETDLKTNAKGILDHHSYKFSSPTIRRPGQTWFPIFYNASNYNLPTPLRHRLREGHSKRFPPSTDVGSDTKNLFRPSDTAQVVARLVLGENSISSSNWVINRRDC